jgi:hypothetical protein
MLRSSLSTEAQICQQETGYDNILACRPFRHIPFGLLLFTFFFASELLHFPTTNRQDECLPIDIAKQNGMTAVYAAISLRYEVRHAAPIGSAIAELLATFNNTVSSFFTVPVQVQRAARDRSSSFSSNQQDAITGKYEKSIEARLLARQSTMLTEPRPPPDEIEVKRSRSQPALVHTMSPVGSGASVASASVASKSSKKKRKDRRASVTEMSTSATTAAIEAVTQAMRESGGDISKAALLLMQQQQKQGSRERRRSSRRDDRGDDQSVSVSVISEGTTLSKSGGHKKRSMSRDNSSSSGSPKSRNGGDDRSVQSGSTTGSRSRSKKNHSRSGLNPDDDASARSRSSSRKNSVRGGTLLPIEEEVVIRRSSRSGSRRGNEDTYTDDVDSDGEQIGPPALLCFWSKPAAKPKSKSSRGDGSLELIAPKNKGGGGCSVM